MVLKDILETEADERPTKDTERNRRHHKTPEQKSLTMTATMYKGAGNNGMTLVPMVDKIPDKSETIKSQYYKSSKANFERKGTFHATGVPLDKPQRVGTANIKGHDIKKRVYSGEGKSPSIIADSGTVPKVVKGGAFRGRAYDKDGKRMDRDGSSVAHKTKQMLELRQDDKSNALTTVQKDTLVVKSAIREKSKTVRSGGRGSYDRHEWDSVDEMHWRKLTPLECERLQTVPDNYTNHVSNTQRYKMLGNGWTIEVIAHILKGIQE